MKGILNTIVALALLLCATEAAAGGTVTIETLLNGAASEAAVGEVEKDISPENVCTITITPALAYSVASVTAVKMTEANNAQARRQAPAINTPLEITEGDMPNTWLFDMPSDEYDVEVTVNFTYRAFGLFVQGTEVTGDNMNDVLGNGKVSFNGETNTLTLNGATIQGTTLSGGCIISQLNSLTISLVGDNIISSNDSCTAIRAELVGDQTLTIVKGGDNCSLTMSTERAIRDFSSVSLTDLVWSGKYSYDGGMLHLSDGEEAANVAVADKPAAPTVSVAGDTYDEAQQVALATTTPDADIRYYFGDESLPLDASSYSAPLDITESCRLNAWAERYLNGLYFYSDTVRVNYVIRQLPPLMFIDPTDQAAVTEMAAATAKIGAGFTTAEPFLYNPTKREVTYSSSATAVATIDDEGQLTFKAPGVTTITASTETGGNYLATSASYILTVEDADPLKPTIVVGNTTDIYADKVLTITQADAAAGDRIVYTVLNNDTQEGIDETVYSEPITLNQAGRYTVTARVRRGQLISFGDTIDVYVLREPQFSPEGGNYNRERQVKLTGLPLLPRGEDDYPQAYIKVGDAPSFTRYYNGDAVTVNETTTITAYLMDKDVEGNELRSDDRIATYTFPPVIDIYQVAVNGITVTSLNKDNVLGDATKSVHYDDNTKTLTLNNATVGSNAMATAIQTSMPLLTVHLVGTSTASATAQAFKSTADDAVVAFTTDADKPGKLFIDCATAFTDITPDYGGTMQLADSWITVKPTEYGITVAGVPVTDANRDNVLNDADATVRFDGVNTLILNGAILSSQDIVSSLNELIVYLGGENAISAITSTKQDAALSFITSPNTPGTLNLEYIDFQGFKAPEYKNDLGLVEKKIISSVLLKTITYDEEKEDPVDPITFNQDDFVNKEGGDEKPVNLENTTIGDILYTLPTDTETDGFDGGTSKEDAGINLHVEVTSEDLDAAMNLIPGSTEFADKFKGMTMKIPEGTGKVIIDLQTDEDYILHVKIGNQEPVEITQATRGKVEIPYSVTEPTYVYIYNPAQQPAGARGYRGSHRDKVTSVHVKIYSVDASMSSVVTPNALTSNSSVVDNRVTIIDFSALGISKDDLKDMTHISLSTINGKPITNLGAGLFSNVIKDRVSYIDLSATAITDVTANRDAGAFDGFSDYTLIIMPAGNSDGGEDNVVIGGECNSLTLGGTNNFETPLDFNAAVAALDRTFTEDQTATVFLPFALSKEQADALGSFHTFKEISGANAVFNEAEPNGTEANKPYIFVPASGVSNFEATNVAVKGLAPDQTSITSGQLIGTYEQIIWDTDQPDIYGFAAEDEGEEVKAGQFVRVAAGASIDPFRAYLKVQAAPARLNVVINGEEGTGIESIASERSTANDVYDLQGRKVNGKLERGLYIVNGNKTVIR